MKDRILFDLNDEWTLGYDQAQWIIFSKEVVKGEVRHRARSFVVGEKATLSRVAGELGCTLGDKAITRLEQLPNTFKEFIKYA